MLKKIVITLILVLWPLNFILNFGNFRFSTETIFKDDYQAKQLILRNIGLYPTPLFARVFQNKPRIYINKYLTNFFSLTDPNNYFFGLHPQPIHGYVNIFKYPFLTIIFFFFGIFGVKKFVKIRPILFFLVTSILLLSTLANPEGFDLILWVPLSFIIIKGVNVFYEKHPKSFKYFSLIFILFAIPEIIRVFYTR